MYNTKKILTAASLAVLAMTGAASAQPWNHRDRDPIARHETFARRPIVLRERVYDTLRMHHYRGAGVPAFIRGHYVVKSFNRFGRVVFVEIDPTTGAFLGEFRI